jgi:serine/threonine protein phosphatase 1
MSETIYYAIGDIHGEAERLVQLYEYIAEDAARFDAPSMIVHLGDLIDRGPDSRAVVDLAMQMEAAGAAITIKGNHEEMMLNAYDNAGARSLHWPETGGGDETILSYQEANGLKDDWREAIDGAHLRWLRALPVQFHDEARNILFVHAGINPALYPNCPDEVKLWTRTSAFFESEDWPERPELEGLMVVHGHTPTDDSEPEVRANRINVDTGACYGGWLTCVVLAPGEPPRFLRA